MNTTSRAFLQTMLSTDPTLSSSERSTFQRLVNGEAVVEPIANPTDERLLITQKTAAKLLSVSRVTIWRMTKDGVLHPVEILAGTWRYSYREVAALAGGGFGINAITSGGSREISVA